jgi:sterol desaturase/sphingolipid hydroxylase (fatty acid hydroxylase superfamily)
MSTMSQVVATAAPEKAKFHKGSARMFRSDFFEWFSHVHPATPAVLFLPLVAFAIYMAVGPKQVPVGNALAWVFGGYLTWTLFEYWFHRLFFHLEVRGPRTERIYFFIHGVHHDWPWDRTRLVMPPSVSISIGLLAYLLFRGIFGVDRMWAPYAGFVLGYVIYDTVHWYTHAGKPKHWLGKLLRREHLVHHFRESSSRFGVSCPWWDKVFRTEGTPDELPTGAAQESAR